MSWKDRLTSLPATDGLSASIKATEEQKAVDATKIAQIMESVVDVELQAHYDAIHDVIKAMKVPPEWMEINPFNGMTLGGRAFAGRGMAVIITVDSIRDPDGVEQEWLHLSISRKSKMPEYADLQMVQRFFLDEGKPAYQVFPKKSEHRNLHNFCLHLWQPLTKDPFPDAFGDRAGTVAP